MLVVMVASRFVTATRLVWTTGSVDPSRVAGDGPAVLVSRDPPGVHERLADVRRQRGRALLGQGQERRGVFHDLGDLVERHVGRQRYSTTAMSRAAVALAVLSSIAARRREVRSSKPVTRCLSSAGLTGGRAARASSHGASRQGRTRSGR